MAVPGRTGVLSLTEIQDLRVGDVCEEWCERTGLCVQLVRLCVNSIIGVRVNV